MLPGQRKPLGLPEDEKYDGLATQFVSKNVKHSNKLLFPALNSFNNFAIIDYKAHMNKIIDYSINLVFKAKQDCCRTQLPSHDLRSGRT